MKIDISENPYGKGFYSGYLVFNKKEGRRYVILFKDNLGHASTSVSYARFLLAGKIGRKLENDEQADHIDNDKTNDTLDNLQLLSKKENIQKYIAIRESKKKKDHGTRAMVRSGCKCEKCKAKRREYNHAWYIRHKDEYNKSRKDKRSPKTI